MPFNLNYVKLKRVGALFYRLLVRLVALAQMHQKKDAMNFLMMWILLLQDIQEKTFALNSNQPTSRDY